MGAMRRATVFGLALVIAGSAARAENLRVQLIQPAANQPLRGGATAVLEWTSPDIAAADDIEEWEAFLSIDGGRYYGSRITAHTDITTRRVQWTVPNVDSKDVRILMRFGDEREEIAVELPAVFAIEASAPSAAPVKVVEDVGEPARPGDPGVRSWAESETVVASTADSRLKIEDVRAPVDDKVDGDERNPEPSQPGCVQRGPSRRSEVVRMLLDLAANILRRSHRLNI